MSIRGSVAIVYCMGTLDRSLLEDLGGRVRALTHEGVRGFVCSLERVTHIHFQALDSFLALHQLLRDAGGGLVLTEVSPYLRQILDFGGVPTRVPVLDDRHQAVEEMLGVLPIGEERAVAAASLQQTFF